MLFDAVVKSRSGIRFCAVRCLSSSHSGEWVRPICCTQIMMQKGVLAILVFYMTRQMRGLQIVAGCLAFCWELPAIVAFIPIAFYNGKRGWNIKYLFYAFYPVHLLVLYLICVGDGNRADCGGVGEKERKRVSMEISKETRKRMMQIIAFGILLYCGMEHFDVVIGRWILCWGL